VRQHGLCPISPQSKVKTKALQGLRYEFVLVNCEINSPQIVNSHARTADCGGTRSSRPLPNPDGCPKIIGRLMRTRKSVFLALEKDALPLRHCLSLFFVCVCIRIRVLENQLFAKMKILKSIIVIMHY
jgi:hypothetical protein